MITNGAAHCFDHFVYIEMSTIAQGTIAILEDNAARITEMNVRLHTIISPPARVFVTPNAHEMIAWLENHLAEVALISLDHDLPIRSREQTPDCGDGRMVADFLAALSPTCPVIVHSSNDPCAAGMFYALQSAGWPVSRVVPYDGENWIGQSWAKQIQDLIRTGWLRL